MAEIVIKGVAKRFGSFQALRAIDLTVADREFMVLLGPSGCGKTTLLRIIAGLETPTAGEVWIGGRRVDRLPPRERGIAMVFQNYAVFPHLTVYENIAFGLRMKRLPRETIDERVRRTASLMHIEQLLTRYSGQLSGGQRQRVAVARALAMEPDVILMDEPLSNLDALLRLEMRAELKGVLEASRTTTIYVTHDQVEAMGMGDRIAVIDRGRIRQIGTPKEIYDDPADTFVATFLGTPPMNLVERDGLIFGFRPEHFTPANGSHSDDVVRFQFVVHREEYLGSERLLYGEIGSAKAVARFPATTDVELRIGQPVEYVVARRHLKFFNPRTGERTRD